MGAFVTAIALSEIGNLGMIVAVVAWIVIGGINAAFGRDRPS
jgi:hypothetical protein